MSGKRGIAVKVAVLVSVLCAAGCGPKKTSTLEPAVVTKGTGVAAQTPENRIEALSRAVEQFTASRNGLRGHADAQSRRELAGSLSKLNDVLTNLAGPQAGGAFRQQMRIIDRARTTLTSDGDTAPEPTVNAAIRAAQNALSEIASDTFADDGQVKTLMDTLRSRVDTLDTVRGPIHGFETAKALDEIGAIAQRMSDVLRQRLPQEQPATAPATPATKANG